ncbi:hypothetical protein [Streptomyces sp. NPDC050121]|uniref:hypothetical protein n=1 Tax=Streptomyces sp. NPDC050121 TaxID=3365601 RepID=UPI0037A9F941
MAAPHQGTRAARSEHRGPGCAPCTSEFRNARGRRRVRTTLPEQVVRDYGGGFVGLLRPELYERLLDALPKGVLPVNHTVERVAVAPGGRGPW